jgi:hypothetical protein
MAVSSSEHRTLETMSSSFVSPFWLSMKYPREGVAVDETIGLHRGIDERLRSVTIGVQEAPVKPHFATFDALPIAVRLCNVKWGRHKNVSEKLLDSRTVLFITQRRKPTKIRNRGKISACVSASQKPPSKADCAEKGASLVVNLKQIPKRLPCLIVDSSPEEFRHLEFPTETRTGCRNHPRKTR